MRGLGHRHRQIPLRLGRWGHFVSRNPLHDARRTARFDTIGHTPGPVDVAQVESELARLDGYPRTLDLRRPASLAPAAPLRP